MSPSSKKMKCLALIMISTISRMCNIRTYLIFPFTVIILKICQASHKH
ncbi:hypothetical protein Patl1_36627 [Pistacia atlantica]|nr:hypothetical protein Patl1_36627 [Pistacia atlantica]